MASSAFVLLIRPRYNNRRRETACRRPAFTVLGRGKIALATNREKN